MNDAYLPEFLYNRILENDQLLKHKLRAQRPQGRQDCQLNIT